MGEAAAAPTLASQLTHQQLTGAGRRGGFLMGAFSVPTLLGHAGLGAGRAACCGPELVGFVVNSRLTPAQHPPLAQAISNQLLTLCYRQRALDTYR